MENEILKKAYHYITQDGYSVIPIKKEDKKPAIESWLNFQKVLPEPEQARDWWGNSDFNIAIITGPVSNITVIDLDRGKKDGKETPLDAFPKTFTVKTPSGGYHLIYNYTPIIKQSANAWPEFPHLDIRNDGGYIVASPSVTDAGKYEIIHDVDVIDFPVHLFKITKNKTRQGIQTLTHFKNMGEGDGRNEALTSVANHLFKILPKHQWGMVVLAIRGANKEFTTPLPDKEVETITNSMMKRSLPNKNIDFHVDPKGHPYITGENILKIFLNDNDFIGKFRYNTFTGIPETIYNTKKWVPLMKEQIYLVYLKIQEKYPLFNSIPLIHIESSLVTIAHQNELSPIAEYIKKLEWDKKKRLDMWISIVFKVKDNTYHKEIGSNWIKALVKRVIFPGCQMDNVLIIDGDQGAGKSRALRELCNFEEVGNLFHETSETPDNKDFIISLLGNIVIEFSEGASMRYTNAMKMKSFITKQDDKYRPPYEKASVQFPRQCVFAMTTNESQYLKDGTGNRRWYPVSMDRNKDVKVDVAWIKENRDQLLAEAYARIQEPHWELTDEAAEHLDELHDQKTTNDPMTEYIVEWHMKLSEEQKDDGVIPTQAFREAMPDGARFYPSPLEAKKIGEIFVDILKLKQRKKAVEGMRVVRYFPTEHTPKDLGGVPDTSGF